MPTDSKVTAPPRKSLFGILSLVGIPLSILVFVASAGRGSAEFGAWAAIGACWITLFGSFVCAVIGLIRKERPLWPAVIGLIFSIGPGVLFLFGLIQSILYHLGYVHG